MLKLKHIFATYLPVGVAVMTNASLARTLGLVPLLALGACGGGGGGVRSTPTPPPTVTSPPVTSPPPSTTPAPPPPVTPPASSPDSAEYRASIGPVSANALVAYRAGASGAGVTIGIIDSGIDLQSAEFDNRISAASADFAGNASADDIGGHGTAVAFTAAGRRNDVGTHGFAPQATVLALRTDEPGSCEADDGCQHPDDAITRAVDAAVANRARVINISLGGSAMAAPLINAVSRATAAGIVIVISAGNDSEANPDPFAAVATTTAARGLVIIAGSVGTNDAISEFSNRAGTGQQVFLSAVGERVRAPDESGQPYLWSGTSFSAPQISGAVALLAQAFPNLTGARIVELLYASARDAGAAGTDAIYGRGVLDLTRTFQPQGATSSAATGQAVSLTDNGALSTPMGDARQGGLGAIVLDGFDRAYAVDLGRTITRASLAPRLRTALESTSIVRGAEAGALSLSLTTIAGRRGAIADRLALGMSDARSARLLAGHVARRLGVADSIAIGFGESATALTSILQRRGEAAFLVARDPSRTNGFESMPDAAFAWRRDVGRIGVTGAIESGNVLSPRADALMGLRDRWRRDRYDRVALGADTGWSWGGAGLTASWLREGDTVLGARFAAGIGAPRADSLFVDATARVDLGAWSLAGAARRGWTVADARLGVAGGGRIATSGYALDLGRADLLSRGDRFGLRVAQPLRVESGAIGVTLASGYDYATGVSGYADQRINLAPRGREIDVEARYGRAIGSGWIDGHLFWRRDPGHIAALPDDAGAALRLTLGL